MMTKVSDTTKDAGKVGKQEVDENCQSAYLKVETLSA